MTGGYSGIGVEAIRAFRSAVAKVVVQARDTTNAKTNPTDIPDVRLEIIDLLDQGSIDALAERFLRDGRFIPASTFALKIEIRTPAEFA